MGNIQIHSHLPIELVNLLDSKRGEIPLSSTIRCLMTYICRSPESLKSIIESEYRNSIINPKSNDSIRKYRKYDTISIPETNNNIIKQENYDTNMDLK